MVVRDYSVICRLTGLLGYPTMIEVAEMRVFQAFPRFRNLIHLATASTMKLLSIIFVGAVLFCLFMVVGFRSSRRNPPDKLKALQRLLPADWKLETWGWWEMGWFAKFEFKGRRFDVGSHRDDIEISEMVGADRRVIAPESPKSPEQIFELLAKAVA